MNSTRQFRTPVRDLVYYEHRRDGSIVVFDGETYRRQDDGPNGPALPSFNEQHHREVSRLRHHKCQFGDYPWDHWKAWALEDGVPEDLADLGRALIREADQHAWSPELQRECGWTDNGAAMIQLVLRQPDTARKRWRHLLETDGDVGDS